jgi:hypothetical protein
MVLAIVIEYGLIIKKNKGSLSLNEIAPVFIYVAAAFFMFLFAGPLIALGLLLFVALMGALWSARHLKS